MQYRSYAEEHDAILQVVNSAEKKCGETYSRIRARLNDLRELSSSNLALKRLIKRNQKRESKIARGLNSINHE